MQIPGPDTRVVELRVHGILGTTGESLTDAVASVDVAGDGVGRVVRPADRLLRPVPGPRLQAGERTVPRIVEGYVWGGMTSGGLGKATWSLLFPFALANMAHWMLPPVRADRATSRVAGFLLRAVLRVVALLLTMLLVGHLTVLTLDLFATQCLAPGTACLRWWPDWLREPPALRAGMALLPIALVVLLMHRLSTVSWRRPESRRFGGSDHESDHPPRAPILPGANVVSDPDTPALRALHSIAALASAALLAVGGPFAPGGAADPRWWVAITVIGVAILAAALLDDPSGQTGDAAGRWLRSALRRPVRRTLLVVAVLLLATSALAPGPLLPAAPGSGDTIDVITFAILALWAAFAALLVPAALLARGKWSALPRTLRPWTGGWMAAPVLLIACLLGSGFGAGLSLTVRQFLGGVEWRLPRAYDDVTLLWGTATTLGLASALVLVPVVLSVRRFGKHAEDPIPPEVALLHAGRQQDQRGAASAWRWADVQRRLLHHLFVLLAGVLLAGVITSLALRQLGVHLPGWTVGLLSGVGVITLAGLAAGLLRTVYQAAKHPDTARHLGVLCDLALFWPREAHPVVPPCYALKVIPEVAERASEHLKDPDTRVVLVGHSQGSLLATVAAARLMETLPESDRERVGLVTAGSQLQWAYPRAFPNVVPHSSLLDLSAGFGDRWRSLCRGTDPLGGAVSTWERQVFDGMLIGVGFRGDGTQGPLPAATRGPTGALVLGNDHWLPDPQRGPSSFRRWEPGVLGHSEYSADPEWDRAVAMAAGLEAPVRSTALPLSEGSPTLPTLGAHGLQRPTEPRRRGGSEPTGGTPAPMRDTSGEDGAHPAEEAGVLIGASPAGTAGDEPSTAAEAVPSAETAPPATADDPDPEEPRKRSAPWERASALRACER